MSGPFASQGEAREIAEVNVVPLADVSLVLLIILLVLSPALRESMLHVRSAAAPAAAPAPAVETLAAAPPELVLVVGLAADGYYLGAAKYARQEDLGQALRAELQRRADKKVFLAPYGDATVEAVVRALELVKASGAESVALVQTQEEKTDGALRPPAPAP